MHIMTQDGWRPLYNPTPIWAARHALIESRRTSLADAHAMPQGNDDDRRARHNAIMASYRGLSDAQDALVGA